jgi:tetratricopeptide (TPR) repeat protein
MPGDSETRDGGTLSISGTLAQAQNYWQAGQAAQAEMLCQRVLAAWPGQSDALHLLGLMAHGYGKLDLAISYLQEACKAPSARPVYASNLAEMCRQAGRLTEGEAAARHAVAADPQLAGAWNNLGIILQEAGKFEESLNCLERTLRLRPQDAEVFNNLGNTCKRLGRLAEAQRHWEQALRLRPDYAEPHSNLSNLLCEQGDFSRAADHAKRAIEINATLADAYINLAGVEAARHNIGEALRWLDRLLVFAPSHAAGLTARAQLLQKEERPEEALAAACRALDTAPQNAEAHNARGAALQLLGRTDEALAAFEQAALLPGVAAEQALVNAALLRMEHGAREQTQSAFARALARFPDSPTILYNYADFRRFTPGDPLIAHMETLLAGARALPPAGQTMLHFALGKAYLDTGDAAQAFHHLEQGNKRKRAEIVYSAETATRLMTQIEERFSAAFLRKMAGSGPGSRRPVFVIGMPRSGTTLTEQILAAHPHVFGAGELRHVQRLADGVEGFPGTFAELAAQNLHALGQAYLDQIAPLAPGARHIVDKLPFNFAYAGMIRLILPGARIIHVRRNAMDTCLSCYSKLFTGEQLFAYDQTELGRFYRDYERLSAHWRKVLPESHYLEIEYEALIEDVEGQARRMIAFLGLGWDPACLDFHRAQRPVRTASVNQVRRPVYKTSAGRWKAYQAYLQPLRSALAPFE